MNGPPMKAVDPDLLLEASRVMNAAGTKCTTATSTKYTTATRAVSDWAVRNVDNAGRETRAAILGDGAALSLRQGKYDEALARLQKIGFMDYPDPLDPARLYILRALANGQKYKDLKRKNNAQPKPEKITSEADFTQLRQSIRDDLTEALKCDKNAISDNKGYWQQHAAPATPTSDVEDDLLMAFQDAKSDGEPLVPPDDKSKETGTTK